MDTVTHLAAVAWGFIGPSGGWVFWAWVSIGVIGMVVGLFSEG